MRSARFVLLFLLGTTVLAGERPASGPENLLGDATLSALAPYGDNPIALATDGDRILMAWGRNGSLYAQLVDREGRLAAELPVLLEEGTPYAPHDDVRAVWAGGFFHVFARTINATPFVVRVTRDLEIVDRRALNEIGVIDDIAMVGDEIIIATHTRVWRLRSDLSVIAEIAQDPPAPRTITPSPRGTFIVTRLAPAITVERLEAPGGRVRIAPYEQEEYSEAGAARVVWTGTEFVALWTECRYSCASSMARFDETFRAVGDVVWLGLNTRSDVTRVGDDTVLVVQDRGAQRYRKGVAVDEKPVVFRWLEASLVTPDGRLFAVEENMALLSIPPPGAQESPVVTARPQTAVEEKLLAVAASSSGIAVSRSRVVNGRAIHLVSILDNEGRVVREVELPWGYDIGLASDGKDYFALGKGLRPWFQKVEQGAPPVEVAEHLHPVFAWNGDLFVMLQTGWTEIVDGREVYQDKTRLRWYDRNGQPVDLPCEPATFRGAIEGWDIAVHEGGGKVYFFWYGSSWELRDGCAVGVPVQRPFLGSSPPRLAWRDGIWALLSANLSISFAGSATAFGAPVRDLPVGPASGVAIAPLGGRWLVVYDKESGHHTAIVDDAGNVLGTADLAGVSGGAVRLLPVARDRVLAVYERPVYEKPYLGVTRVLVAPITIEPGYRRRGVRP